MNYAQPVGYIYAIENTVNSRCYIGSTANYKSRWHTHRSRLRNGKHHSFILQRAWDKYGEGAFVFKLLVVCPLEQRIDYENRLMPLQSYNIARTAKETLVRGGWKHTAEVRQRLSESHKGRKFTEEHRKNMAQAARNRVYDAAFKEKARQRQISLLSSEKYRNKLYEYGENARKVKIEKCKQKTVAAHKLVLEGATVKNACEAHNLAQETFYKYTKLMNLVLRGRKKPL